MPPAFNRPAKWVLETVGGPDHSNGSFATLVIDDTRNSR
ncbi:hypothetical protein CVCC1112_4094 [Paenarthrobacter nicotinovorans]|nr:hypothetical protein CVCC1112_4094 [Paenarthrobacter nicotinovorans]